MKRQFNSGKLYKLLRFFVIIIVIFCIWFIYLDNKDNGWAENNYVKDLKMCLTQETSDIKTFSYNRQIAYSLYDSCMNRAPQVDINMANSYQASAGWEFGIAVLLPIIFFGGRLIYKYTFPYKKDVI